MPWPAVPWPTTDRLSADELARGWAQVVGTIGALESTGEPTVTAGGIGTVVDIPLRFEAGDRTGRLSFSIPRWRRWSCCPSW